MKHASSKDLEKVSPIPTLMYHKIKDQVAHTKDDQSMSASRVRFEAQLKALLEVGYTIINFKEINGYLEGKAGFPKSLFLLQQMMGILVIIQRVYPILKKYNVQATFFVNSLYGGITNENEHFHGAGEEMSE